MGDTHPEVDMKELIFIMLAHKMGYLANEIVGPLKLIEKGFRKEDLALVILIDFPFQILFGFLTIRWSSGQRPLRPVSLDSCANAGVISPCAASGSWRCIVGSSWLSSL
jgi:hypothetical protein